MTRIAYICTDPGVPVFGCKGSSIHVQEVIRALICGGSSVTLFARRFGGVAPADLESVQCVALPRPTAQDAAARERQLFEVNNVLPERLNTEPAFDMVYERHALWSHAAMDWAQARGIPALLEVNAPLIEEQAEHRVLHDRIGAEACARRAYDMADHIIAVSTGVTTWLANFGVDDAKMHFIPNGVDTRRFAPTEPVDRDELMIGFVGTLKPWHGLSVLVEATRIAKEADVPVRLLIVGNGPERAALRDQLEAAGLGPVSELTGAVDPAAIPALIARMDVALAPYPNLPNFYFSPLKIMEYMAAGRAIVASRIGDIDGLITDEVDGLLCTAGDAQAFADAVIRLHYNRDLQAGLGFAARDKAVRDLSWDCVVKRILDLTMERAPC